MIIKQQRQRPNKLRNISNSAKKDKYNNIYYLQGDELIVKFFTFNKYIVIHDIDYRLKNFCDSINDLIFYSFGTKQDVTNIFEREGII